MKKSKLRELIQKPLRFHHQDIHESLERIEMILSHILIELENNKQEEKIYDEVEDHW